MPSILARRSTDTWVLRQVDAVLNVRVYVFAAFYEASGASARNQESIRFCRTLTPPCFT